MINLAIDSSGMIATVAILMEDKTICNYSLNNGRTHSENLLPMIKSMFDISGISLSEIDFLTVAKGPGSYTGLRIGISTAKALAHSLNKPIVAVSTLEGLYYNVKESCNIVCPIIDARRTEVYTSVYKNNINVYNESAVPLSDVLSFVKGYNENVIFVGDGVLAYRGLIIDSLQKNAIFAPEHLLLQNAACLGRRGFELFNNGETITYKELTPHYLKNTCYKELNK